MSQSRPHRSRGGRRARWAAALAVPAAVLLGTVTPAAVAPPAGAATRPLPVPADQPARGLHWEGLVRPRTGPCAGHYELAADPGTCTHGPDPAPAGRDVRVPRAPLPRPTTAAAARQAAAAAAVTCQGDGSSGNRVQLVYVYAAGSANRYSQYAATFASVAGGVDDIYAQSAAETGGVRHVRFATSGSGSCTPTVQVTTVSAGDLADFGRTRSALLGQGYDRADRKYLVFADSTVYCGIGDFADDDSKTSANKSNVGREFARVDSGCWDANTATHELGHTLGAVSNSAPDSSRSGHCVDESDVMCYSDSPYFPAMQQRCPTSHENRLDCNHDDYYSTSPAPGSYLATHYNVADNPFLAAGGGSTGGGTTGTGGRALVGRGSGRCLDVYGAGTADGTAVGIWDCLGGANQSWVASGGRLVDRNSGKCLDAAGVGTANGTQVWLWTCQDGNVGQQWVVNGNGTITNPHANRCLDVAKRGTANGTRVQLWDCAGTVQDNQAWSWR